MRKSDFFYFLCKWFSVFCVSGFLFTLRKKPLLLSLSFRLKDKSMWCLDKKPVPKVPAPQTPAGLCTLANWQKHVTFPGFEDDLGGCSVERSEQILSSFRTVLFYFCTIRGASRMTSREYIYTHTHTFFKFNLELMLLTSWANFLKNLH